jgi:D-galactarolactone cycloisomerase
MIIGRDPLDSSVIWESLYNKFRDHSPRGNAIEAISAIDIALWDIKGKAMGVPIYKLLGGATREKVTPYATGLYRRTIPSNVNELVNEAIEYVKQGFSAIKIKIGFGIEDDVNCVREIRKTVGDKVKLMVDANHAYNASNAILLSRSIEEYDITWFEEPVPPEDISGYIEVKSKTSIPVSGGEAEFCRYGFNTLLGQRAVDIVQPDCCVTGGISEFQKISVLASIYNIQCYPHIWGSSIAVHAGLHCALALPDFPNALIPAPMYLEYDRTPNIFRERLASHPLIITDGLIKAPTGSGLGIDVDEDLIKNHSIA